MRPLLTLFFYVLIVLLGGAFVAPFLFHFTQSVAGPFPSLQELADSPFHRYLNRSLLGVAVIGLWPVSKVLNVGSLDDVGLTTKTSIQADFLRGLRWGVISLTLLAFIIFCGSDRQLNFDHSGPEVLRHLVRAGIAALVVSLVEEAVFRGVLFGSLIRCRYSFATAAFVSSFIYALAHFFHRPTSPDEITWSTGFALLPHMLRGFGNFEALVPALPNLLIAGALLASACYRSGSLFLGIGIHAGWIFSIKTFSFITTNSGAPSTWLWGSEKMIDGWAAVPILTGLFLITRFEKTPKSSSSSRSAT